MIKFDDKILAIYNPKKINQFNLKELIAENSRGKYLESKQLHKISNGNINDYYVLKFDGKNINAAIVNVGNTGNYNDLIQPSLTNDTVKNKIKEIISNVFEGDLNYLKDDVDANNIALIYFYHFFASIHGFYQSNNVHDSMNESIRYTINRIKELINLSFGLLYNNIIVESEQSDVS